MKNICQYPRNIYLFMNTFFDTVCRRSPTPHFNSTVNYSPRIHLVGVSCKDYFARLVLSP